jgi:hypothetical protein
MIPWHYYHWWKIDLFSGSCINEGWNLHSSFSFDCIDERSSIKSPKGIKAIALIGGIHNDEIINLLDNCQFGNYKFLYISPERLQTDWILERIKICL